MSRDGCVSSLPGAGRGSCRDNEQTNRLLVVHVSSDPEGDTIKTLSKHIEMFDAIYPKIKISLLTVTGSFSPEIIDWLST